MKLEQKKKKIIYDQLVEITHNIINEAFSTKVITPGITTTDDVVWWMREKVLSLNLKHGFILQLMYKEIPKVIYMLLMVNLNLTLFSLEI